MPLIDMQGATVPNYWIEGLVAYRVAVEPLLVPLAAVAELTVGEIEEARPIGVRISPGAEIDRLLAALDAVELIVIDFPSFRDGRGFSLATRLRNRHGFRGELRASGHVLPDQFAALRRCGFTTVETPDHHPPEAWQSQVLAEGKNGTLLTRLLAATERPTLHLRSK